MSEYRVTSSGAMDNLLTGLGLIQSEPASEEPNGTRGEAAPPTADVLLAGVITDHGMSAIRGTLAKIVGGPNPAAMLEIAMAAVVDAVLKEGTEPDWTGLCGPPSCGKTEVIRTCQGDYTRSIDTVASAASFLSGARDPKGREAIPFLEELCERALLIKDMSALLSDDPKKARAILGTLTNLFDGEFNKAIGTAFEGSAIMRTRSRFSLVYATTTTVWQEHSQIVAGMGTRSLMYLVPELGSPSEADYSRARDPFKREYRASLQAQVQARIKEVVREKAPVTIPKSAEEWLQVGAEFIAAGRTPIRSERIVEGDDHSRWVESPGVSEGPFRVYQQIRAKLISLCRLNGHAQPTEHELRIVQHMVFSSVTLARAEILVAVADQEAFMIQEIVAKTKLKADAAVYRLDGMESIGLVERAGKNGRATAYQLARRFRPVLHLPGSNSVKTDAQLESGQ